MFDHGLTAGIGSENVKERCHVTNTLVAEMLGYDEIGVAAGLEVHHARGRATKHHAGVGVAEGEESSGARVQTHRWIAMNLALFGTHIRNRHGERFLARHTAERSRDAERKLFRRAFG